MFLRTALLLALTLTAERSTEGNATATRKQAWEWSVEERIAARTNAAAQRGRLAAFEARREKGIPSAIKDEGVLPKQAVDRIEGREHPELFLPTEVLGSFVLLAYAFGDDEMALDMRQQAARAAAKAGLPSDFLQVFERETADLVPLYAEEMTLRDRLAKGGTQAEGVWDRIVQLGGQQCPLRTAALERLRGMYGTPFDRFLYEHVAPNMFRTYIGKSPAADELRRLDGGCR